MWYTEYVNCPPDSPLKKMTVSPGKGIRGCEMHEINGWGSHYHLETFSEKHLTFSLMTYDLSDALEES